MMSGIGAEAPPRGRRWVIMAAAMWGMASEAASPGCSKQLFAVHWSHIPKAGGTAMAKLARRVACAQNPGLAKLGADEMPVAAHADGWLNPCCVPNLCLSEISCFASTSTCPLVQGIGRHSSSMLFLADMACCSWEWFQRTRVSFYRSAWRAPPGDADLGSVGMIQTGGRWEATRSRAYGMRARMQSYSLWPLESRVAFLAAVGFELSDMEARAELTGIFDRELMTPERLRAIHANYSARAPRIDLGSRSRMQFAIEEAATCHRAAQTLHGDAVADHWLPEIPSPGWRKRIFMPRAEAEERRPCCARTRPGANSMTMLRLPFTRLASAFFYRGHSPNSDNYSLRPGVFRPATNRRDDLTTYKRYSFREFVETGEYRDIMTKMFGDTQSCAKAARCQRRPACEALAECHAYRNASLDYRHVDLAYRALERHAFVGLLEAYNASTRLAMLKFGVTPYVDGSDFMASRTSYSLDYKCSGAVALRMDPVACRGAFENNQLDFSLYEKVHRLFCRRLDDAHFLDLPDVRAELNARRLCGTTNFSRVDDVCTPLEQSIAQLERLKEFCGERRTRAWHWGYDRTVAKGGVATYK